MNPAGKGRTVNHNPPHTLQRTAMPVAFALLVTTAMVLLAGNDTGAGDRAPGDARQIAVLWTSGDPEVAHRVALMYTHAAAAQGWFDPVQLIVWGPSARLLAADKDAQAYVVRLQDAGVQVEACIVCADSYGVTDKLRSLQIEVRPMGRPLTELIHDDGWQVLTF